MNLMSEFRFCQFGSEFVQAALAAQGQELESGVRPDGEV